MVLIETAVVFVSATVAAIGYYMWYFSPLEPHDVPVEIVWTTLPADIVSFGPPADEQQLQWSETDGEQLPPNYEGSVVAGTGDMKN